MQIVNVNWTDTGNQCFKLTNAINETFPTVHKSRAFTKQLPAFTAFEQDVLWDEHWKDNGIPEWIWDYWKSADVVHRHAFLRWSRGWPPASKTAGRIMHQHGRFGPRVTPVLIQDEDKRLLQIRVVSTLNLLRWVCNDFKRWFPPPMDIVRLDRIKKQYGRPRKSLVVVHTPTQRGLKQTKHFLHVMKEIRKKYPKVQVQLIEGRTHAECLRLRANADICFDQLLLQYGTSGLEGMTMGQPVIAGCNDETWEKMKCFLGVPPFVRATPATLFKVMERLIADAPYRKYMGRVGRSYVETYHSFGYTARLAIETYKEAKEWMSCSVR